MIITQIVRCRARHRCRSCRRISVPIIVTHLRWGTSLAKAPLVGAAGGSAMASVTDFLRGVVRKVGVNPPPFPHPVPCK